MLGNLTPSHSGKGDRNGCSRVGRGTPREFQSGKDPEQDLLLDDDFLDGGDSCIVAEGAAEVFGFLPCLVLVVGLD
jgi:hypothetical protein